MAGGIISNMPCWGLEGGGLDRLLCCYLNSETPLKKQLQSEHCLLHIPFPFFPALDQPL